MNDLWSNVKTAHDFALVFSEYIHANGSTTIPEEIALRLGGHPQGKGTYRLDPTDESQFGFEIFGSFSKAPQKNMTVGTIMVTKGGFKVTKDGKTEYYADFDVRDDNHKSFHLHPDNTKNHLYYETQYGEIRARLLEGCSEEIKAHFNTPSKIQPKQEDLPPYLE